MGQRHGLGIEEMVGIAGANDPHDGTPLAKQILGALPHPLDAIDPRQNAGVLERLDRLGNG
jgi:hypothetical protein